MDPEQGECYLSGRILLMKIEELREILVKMASMLCALRMGVLPTQR